MQALLIILRSASVCLRYPSAPSFYKRAQRFARTSLLPYVAVSSFQAPDILDASSEEVNIEKALLTIVNLIFNQSCPVLTGQVNQ